MNKFSHFDLILKFLREKNTKQFWDELNDIITSHNDYYRRLQLNQKIKLASESSISFVKERNYNSFAELRQGVIPFPINSRDVYSDFELFILVLKRCNLVYTHRIVVNDYANESCTNFSSFIKKINEYIDEFTYEEIIKVPEFFLPYDEFVKINNDYINSKTDDENKFLRFSKNEHTGSIHEDANLLNRKRSSVSDKLTKFDQKKNFYDMNTEFISREKIFIDSKQDLLFKYQYLINNFFNKFTKEYIEKNNISSENLCFIYKGGTFMKILYQKYNNIFKLNKDFMKLNEDYFKRSDSDYCLYLMGIDDAREYFKHYYWMNVATYNILKKITKFINSNLDDILPINQLTDKDLEMHLENANKILNNDKERVKNGKQKKLTYFDDVNNFIGITIGNKTFFKETLPDKYDIKFLKKLDKNDLLYIDEENEDSNFKDKIEFMKKNKYINTDRKPFYITIKHHNNIPYQVVANIDDDTFNESGVYQYYNESNKFLTANDAKTFLNYFTLHRVKLNIILYYKNVSKNDTDISYGYLQCPAELIDIPISTFYDYKRNIDYNQDVSKIENVFCGEKIIFNAYSLHGLINDIVKQIFIEQKFPWLDVKYEKKIHRLVCFYIIYLNNIYSNMEEIKQKIIDFFNNYEFEKLKLSFKTYAGKELHEDHLFNKIFESLSKLKKKIDADTNISEKNANSDKITNIKNIFISGLNTFKPEEIKDELSDDETLSVPYLKKYLKYKKKYLSIKNKK